MFNYFLKSFNKCKSRVDVTHLSKQFLKNIFLFNTHEIALCLNKFSKIQFEDKIFWNNVCHILTTKNSTLLQNFKRREVGQRVDQQVGGEVSAEVSAEDSAQVEHIDQFSSSDIQHEDQTGGGRKEHHYEEEQYYENHAERVKDRGISRMEFNKEWTAKEEVKKSTDKMVDYFTMEELCLVLNALAKVNVKNEEILNLASNKIISEIDLNKHIINAIKSIDYFTSNGDKKKAANEGEPTNEKKNMHNLLQTISRKYEHVNKNLTEKDVSVLIEIMLSQENMMDKKKEGTTCPLTRGEHVVSTHNYSTDEYNKICTTGMGKRKNNDIICEDMKNLKKKVISSLKKMNYISEQSIALILNAYSRSLIKNKALLDILKVIIILKIKKENYKCSDIFISSVSHSYSSFYYKDKLLFNILAEYTYNNIDSISIKALVIIMNSFVNIGIVNIPLFNASLNKFAKIETINSLSNQCTSNIITILTKSYKYLDKAKIHFIIKTIIKRIKKEYSNYSVIYQQKYKQINIYGNKDRGNDKIRIPPSFSIKGKEQQTGDENYASEYYDEKYTRACYKDEKYSHSYYNEQNYKEKGERVSGGQNKKRLFERTPNKYNSKCLQNGRTNFLAGFLIKHLTNILNNLSKLNYADSNLFEIFSDLILKNQKNMNKLDFLNIISSYARFLYINKDMYELIKVNSIKYITSKDLKYVEFINLFTSVGTFYIIEKSQNKCLNKLENTGFKDIIHLMINRLKEGIHSPGITTTMDAKASEGVGASAKSYPHVCTEQRMDICTEHDGRVDLFISSKSGSPFLSTNYHTFDEQKGNLSKSSLRNDYFKHALYKNCNSYNYSTIKYKNILDNLSLNHVCSIMSTLGKLHMHDKIIYEQCIKNIKKKIFKMNAKCLAIYLLYVSKFNLTPDSYITAVISRCFKVLHVMQQKNEKNNIYDKLKNLYIQLQTNDIVNPVYIVRCLIKSDLNYRNNIYIIYHYMKIIYSIIRMDSLSTNKEKPFTSPPSNIVKIDESDLEENNMVRDRKLNVQSCCVLINSIAFLNTHLHFNHDKYFKLISFLLFYSFKYIFERLELQDPINDLLYNITQVQQINKIKNEIKKKNDSASIRQIYMTILILFHLNSLSFPYSKKKKLKESNISIYSINLLKFFFFFLKYNPFTHFEKYTSIYNSMNNNKRLTIYKEEEYTPFVHNKNVRLTNGKMPHISNIETVVFYAIVNILKKKNQYNSNSLSSTVKVYMYTIDILIMRKGW
ncbi:conserved Plasmodium protein, unknown function [Plasmodium malariae]|uniref:Uncharacterized protein n=2 Tax=Plasmodium (Plasmodium) TaxID=418103 RepID=A0A1D3SN19_PLAMA|nr:conserved Plasmodium protein, unknown function [Plasmodium malariae]SCO93293.1 conserved Plasmodium protein, unknown function [Plasmodium malariae]